MATLLETASLVMVPSGYEDGTLGSLQPLDGTGDFTFTRGSNISATRVNEDGYIEKGYENLLLQSNTFSDTAWTKYNLTATGSQEGYDNTNDAWLISLTGGSGQLRNSVSTNGVQTFSVYAKADTLPFVALYFVGSGEGQYFDLENGTLGNVFVSDTIDSSIESMGNGWYKCSITTNDNISQVRIYPSEANSTSATSGSIYIQDAMLNEGLVAMPYIETTAAPEKGGILADLPRVDYSSGGASLLLEPQRTNENPNSEYLAGGILSNATLSLSGTSPEGLSSAYALTENTSNAEHYWVSERMTTATNNNLVSTIFVKPNGRTKIRLWNYHLANQMAKVDINLTNNTTSNGGGINVSFVSADVTDYANGWKRVEIQTIKTSSTYAYGIRINLLDDSGNDVYVGDGASGVYIYGAQMEQDATYPTSYIPTYGTSQTRLRDSASKTGISNLIGQTEGAVFLEVGEVHNNSATGPTKWFFRVIKDANNSFGIGSGGIDSNPPIRFVTIVGGVITTEHEAAGFSNSKIVIKYTSTDFKLFQNGVLKNITSKSIGGYADIAFMEGASDNLSMPLKQHIVFPTALSDEACIELTTL